ncbi:MAG: prepilin-type N-terminal cleavage/methylation domain-containing protein [Limibaculum sp.]
MGARRAYRDLEGGRRQAGFTLVELLVAMTLLAFLSITLFGGLRFGARSWEAVVDSSAERDHIASTQTFLRDRLGQLTLPGPAGRRRSDADGGLDGGPERVEFVAPWLSALSLGGLYRFTLWHEDTGDGRLMLSWQPAEADPDALEELGDLAGERILLDGVAEFSLSYYGAPDEDAEPEWLDQWESPGAPPRLVRVDLAFADARRVWPVFIVAPKF